MPWARRASKPIPSITSRTATYEINDYSKGFNSFLSNDKLPIKDGAANMWRLAQDARIVTLGEYETRKGFSFNSDAVGETKDQSQETTTGATNHAVSTTIRLAQPWEAAATGRLARLDLRLRNDDEATGTVLVEHWTDDGGQPGEMVARSSIASSSITSSYAYVPVRFASAPAVTSGTTYWIVVYVQRVGTNQYRWSSTSADTNAKFSLNSGSTWNASAYDLNFKQYYSTTGGVKGLHRAYKSDGTAVTLFAHGTVLYKVNDVTGALTTVKTGLNASATHYRFVTVNDIVYYVNGYDGLRKWDFTTEAQVNASNYTHITVHKGLLFLLDATDHNKMVYSNFADYEVFTSTDFIYVPSPKTGDPTTAFVSLNGYLLLFTLDNKYILSGDDNATFRLEEAPDQKGTYTQETTAVDKNFVYYLSEDGVYRSNGSEAQLLSENVYGDVLNMTKSGACMAVNKGRLYLWYTTAGMTTNDKCLVWNLNYAEGSDTVESLDTDAFVSRAVTAFRDDDKLLVTSSRVGQVYWQEDGTNDYSNLGGDINFLLQTPYFTFDSPAVEHEIRRWQPRFGAQSGNYPINCEYATDLRTNWQLYDSTNIQGTGATWGSGATWGDFVWGSTAEVQAYLYVPGQYRRIAIRYKHYATRQPHRFLGHTLVTQTRRLR